jgi:hypothetical protein
LVPPSPYDVHRPAGIQPTRQPSAEASGDPPWTFAPLQSSSPGTRAVPPVSRQVKRHFLSWTFLALRHSPRPGDTCLGSGSLRRPVPRARFEYLLRGSYLRPCRRFRAGASMGFTLQGLPLAAIGTPFGAPSLLPLPDVATSLRRVPQLHPTCFRVLFLRRVRSVARTTSDSGRRYLPGFHPSRASSHSIWRSLWSRHLPSRPWAAGRPGPPGPQGIAIRMGRRVRLRTPNSLGFLYLPTITALRSSLLEAGVLLCLTLALTQR